MSEPGSGRRSVCKHCGSGVSRANVRENTYECPSHGVISGASVLYVEDDGLRADGSGEPSNESGGGGDTLSGDADPLSSSGDSQTGSERCGHPDCDEEIDGGGYRRVGSDLLFCSTDHMLAFYNDEDGLRADGGTAVQKEWVILDEDGEEVLYGPSTELDVRREHDHGDYPESAQILAVPKVNGVIQL